MAFEVEAFELAPPSSLLVIEAIKPCCVTTVVKVDAGFVKVIDNFVVISFPGMVTVDPGRICTGDMVAVETLTSVVAGFVEVIVVSVILEEVPGSGKNGSAVPSTDA